MHEENAVLFDPVQAGAFERALQRLATDVVLRQRVGQAARETIRQQGLTWDGNARRVVALLQSLPGYRS